MLSFSAVNLLISLVRNMQKNIDIQIIDMLCYKIERNLYTMRSLLVFWYNLQFTACLVEICLWNAAWIRMYDAPLERVLHFRSEMFVC